MDYLKNIFNASSQTFTIPKFDWTSVLDILVIAFCIYHVLLWIKQSRAWTLFKGIVLLLIISGVSFWLQLNTVSWIISNTFSVGLIAIIVIFQPELRKALEKLGKGKLTSFLSPVEDNSDVLSAKSVDAIIMAATKMSKARTGALIVVEQQVPLGDLEATGIPVDAVVSSQLILNIFENKTPLHDGAVLIRNNRISAATCILPLTQDKLSSDLGTRHRAGVGASEVSDAYIIIVSEETGNISIAKEGKLYGNVTADEMLEMLSKSDKMTKRKSRLWKGRGR